MVGPQKEELRRQRMSMLESMLEADSNDAFALYGLALELKVVGELERASALLEQLLTADPAHLYGGYQLGEIHLAMGNSEAASAVLSASIEKANALGDDKAKRELSELLAMC